MYVCVWYYSHSQAPPGFLLLHYTIKLGRAWEDKLDSPQEWGCFSCWVGGFSSVGR